MSYFWDRVSPCVLPWLVWNLIDGPGWPETQEIHPPLSPSAYQFVMLSWKRTLWAFLTWVLGIVSLLSYIVCLCIIHFVFSCFGCCLPTDLLIPVSSWEPETGTLLEWRWWTMQGDPVSKNCVWCVCTHLGSFRLVGSVYTNWVLSHS